MVNKYPNKLSKIEIEFTKNVSVLHWSKHISQTLTPLENNFYQGIEWGNIEYAFHSILFYCFHHVLGGTPLDKTKQILKKYHQVMLDKKQAYQVEQCLAPI